MGRLKKLRIEATKKANEALADRQKREIRAKKEGDEAKRAQNPTKDDVFNIVGINRAKSTGGMMQMLSESSKIKENKEAEVQKNPYIHIEVADEDLAGKDNKDIHRDMTQLFNFKKWMSNPIDYRGRDEGKGVVSRDEEDKANLIVSGFPDGDKNIWVAHYAIGKNSSGLNDMIKQIQQDFKEYGNENEIENFTPAFSRFWGKKWWEKEKMDETLNRMNRILNYDVTKTIEENESLDELHIVDPEGLRKALHAKQRAEAGLESDEPTFSIPVVDVSGTDRGAAKDKEVHKSQCCDANAIKYSSKGVKGDIDTHYTCTNCGKISSEPKTKEEVNELFGMFDGHAEKNWKESIEKVIENFFGGDVPESTGQRKYLEDIWDEANEKYDREEGESTSIDVAEIVRKILSGKTKMRKEGTYGRTIDKIIRLANTIKKQKEEENAL